MRTHHPATNWTALAGDVNRDGSADVILAKVETANDEVRREWVSLGNGAGSYNHLSEQDVPHGGRKGPYEHFLADVDNDGDSDLVTNELAAAGNHVWVGLGTADGVFDFSPSDQEHSERGVT